MNLRIDHLVITCGSLDAGGKLIEQLLGVKMMPGGEHPRMGTHNLLLRTGPQTYLEVISVNPLATPPDRPRWFQMDSLHSDSPPRLSTWVAQTDQIHDAAIQLDYDKGSIQEMSRGDLKWHITIPNDGRLAEGGCLPSLIQWDDQRHPTQRLPDSEVTLKRLELFVPKDSRLRSLPRSPEIVIHLCKPLESPNLVAFLATPNGHISLSSLTASRRRQRFNGNTVQ
ncbi:MAG: VOC family protein [Planctomyces sp.]|nr:VOC family protein [Planctomyces sp.]